MYSKVIEVEKFIFSLVSILKSIKLISKNIKNKHVYNWQCIEMYGNNILIESLINDATIEIKFEVHKSCRARRVIICRW